MEVDEDADQNLDLLIGFANKDEYKCHLPISDKYQNLMCWPIYTMENQNFVASNWMETFSYTVCFWGYAQNDYP